MSAAPKDVAPKREKRNQSFLQKKGAALSEEAVRAVLFADCTCDPQCMYTLINEVDNVVEFFLEIRRERFQGAIRVMFFFFYLAYKKRFFFTTR
jgi:hypothetical protein